MLPRRLRVAPVALAAVAVLALGWGAGEATGFTASDVGAAAGSISSSRLEAPASASAAPDLIDTRTERPAKSRWIPLAVVAALVAAVDADRRRHRPQGDTTLRLVHRASGVFGRAPPYLLVTAN